MLFIMVYFMLLATYWNFQFSLLPNGDMPCTSAAQQLVDASSMTKLENPETGPAKQTWRRIKYELETYKNMKRVDVHE